MTEDHDDFDSEAASWKLRLSSAFLASHKSHSNSTSPLSSSQMVGLFAVPDFQLSLYQSRHLKSKLPVESHTFYSDFVDSAQGGLDLVERGN